MAPFHCVFLLSLSTLLCISDIVGDTLPATHQNHQIHQHHGFMHHHRNSEPVSRSARYNDHATQYVHSRHSHEPLLLRRESRILGHRNPVATTTTTTTEATSSTSKVLSYNPVHHQTQRQQQQQRQQSMHLNINDYSKFQPGRRVCSRTSEATSSQAHHHRNRQPRLAYSDLPSGFLCCPGWTQVTRLSFGCNKPVCLLPCQNGGVCSSPGRCTCPKGFAGNYCQIDVDECVTEKPCDQICRNVVGSYECYCRSGYELQSDRQSCRKNDSDGTAFEARDLEEDFEESTSTTRRSILRDTENEVGDGEDNNSYEELLQRLIKLEKQLAKGKKREAETNEITTRIASAIDSINEIRRSIQNMQLMQQEIYELRNKVKLYEFETRKIQQLTSRVIDLEIRLRLQCRSGVYLNSGSTTY